MVLHSGIEQFTACHRLHHIYQSIMIKQQNISYATPTPIRCWCSFIRILFLFFPHVFFSPAHCSVHTDRNTPSIDSITGNHYERFAVVSPSSQLFSEKNPTINVAIVDYHAYTRQGRAVVLHPAISSLRLVFRHFRR